MVPAPRNEDCVRRDLETGCALFARNCEGFEEVGSVTGSDLDPVYYHGITDGGRWIWEACLDSHYPSA